ncbi:LuxR C-terminal-related transcriptional regulator [Saccharomonospora sp. NB11]|uniref:LuxR C-terminal-related transcriptional regulator n=1 Tax=Saccharomonospora sp. NB11 TaxID=1642298 RepID=UPI0027DC59D9|nr:LuxR C-terminal-related transcriptional regulator [Saccharomonospora sp. NB11]
MVITVGPRPAENPASGGIPALKATTRRLDSTATPPTAPTAAPRPTSHPAAWACRFDVPELPRRHVHRRQPLETLSQADEAALVVVTAPAGTGKTALLTEWVKSEGRSGDTAWVTFDGPPTDLADPRVFTSAVVRSLTGLGVDTSAVHDGPSASWVPSVASAVVAAGRRMSVVLDDHHRVTADVADDVDLLLRLTSGRLRLVFAGRRAPRLPLHRYRLAGSVVEIGPDELAFDDDEAAALAAPSGEPPPSRTSVRDWNAYHGGWVAGLALSRHSRDDSRTTPAVDEYFRHEVFEPLPTELRRLLLTTCAVDVFDDDLARDVAGPATDRLLRLAETCAFATTTPDGDRCYPGVVRDALRRALARTDPQQAAVVHTTCAEWLRRRGAITDAVRQYAAARAWDTVSDLLIEEQLVGRLVTERPDGPLHRACRPLAETDTRAAPLVRAALALSDGDTVGCAQALASARGADTAACVAALDALRARLEDDADAALAATDTAQHELGDPGTVPPAGALSASVRVARGVALLRHGDVDLARAELGDTAASRPGRELPETYADCLAHLALADAVEGHLTRAERTAVDALDALDTDETAARSAVSSVSSVSSVSRESRSSVIPPDTSPFPGHAAAHVALGLVALDRCDPDLAWRHAMAAGPVPESLTRHLAHRVVAGVEAAEGHPAAAASRLHATIAEAAPTDPWTTALLRVESARLALLEGHPDLALHELGSLGRAGDTTTSGARSTTHPAAAVVRAAAHLRRDEDGRAHQVLTAATGGFPALRPRVEALVVEAERRLRHGSALRGAPVLDTALRLAAPERLRLPFRQAGPEVRHLLASDPRGAQHWLRGLSESPAAPPVEPLTAREREVLRHLADLLTTEEIAELMVVSVNTVRTHVRGILRKLGVNRRYAAVRRARELGLLDE